VCLLHVAGSASWRFLSFFGVVLCLFHVANGFVALFFFFAGSISLSHVANGSVVLSIFLCVDLFPCFFGGGGVGGFVFYFNFKCFRLWLRQWWLLVLIGGGEIS
jgi:hypothetical protein